MVWGKLARGGSGCFFPSTDVATDMGAGTMGVAVVEEAAVEHFNMTDTVLELYDDSCTPDTCSN